MGKMRKKGSDDESESDRDSDSDYHHRDSTGTGDDTASTPHLEHNLSETQQSLTQSMSPLLAQCALTTSTRLKEYPIRDVKGIASPSSTLTPPLKTSLLEKTSASQTFNLVVSQEPQVQVVEAGFSSSPNQVESSKSRDLPPISADCQEFDKLYNDFIGTDQVSTRLIPPPSAVVANPTEGSCNNGNEQSSRCSSLNYTQIVGMLGSSDNEVDLVVDPPLVTVNGYRVKKEMATVLRSILLKFGDIAKDSSFKSTKIRSVLLEVVCSIYLNLERRKPTDITCLEIKNLLTEVTDLEATKLEVGWLRKRLEEILKAMEENKMYKTRTDENKMSSVSLESIPTCDRISNLPDNVITHILSFLSTKDAVKTSALSTSWYQQWTFVPLIRFYGEDFMDSQSFVNFVYRVLLYKVTPLDLFCLYYGGYRSDISNFADWISIALSRHVREIDVWTGTPTDLPYSLYSSKTLVILNLDGDFVFQVPKKISLESLKILHYQPTEFQGDESFSRLISSCPVLEELKIEGELVFDVKVLNISSLVLKRLMLNHLNSESGEPHTHELVLNTPNLQYLEHSDGVGVPDRYHINTLHCLDTARFSFNLNNYKFDDLIPARPLADLLVAISNVRVLYILRSSFENLYSTALPNFKLPKFDRLIYLELGRIRTDVGLRMLIAFLQSSPQLESLTFYLDCSVETWCPPTDVPFCLLYKVKVIKVDSFRDEELLLNVLTYFLKKTICLEELIILHPEKKGEEFIKKVSMLPRASSSCKISFT